jgi:Flp pilus assembly protein TadG
MPRLASRLAQEERGGVLVMVVLFVPVLVLMVAFVVDVANWFEHKRHLQLQADAGALAAAQDARFPCSDDPIARTAEDYSGSKYNAQVGGTAADHVHFKLNSRTYFNQSSPVDDTVVAAPPCQAKMIDVKLTETDLPWFFRVANVPFINAHARVTLKQVDRAKGALPVGVPDVNPQSARVEFVDETKSPAPVLASRELKRTGSANGLVLWDNADSPVPVKINAKDVGVRVILGGGSSTNCGDPLVECYDLVDQDKGIVHVRGWSAAGSGAQPNAPIDRSVTLYNGTCADPYFSASDCTIGVRARVDFGTSSPVANLGASLTAVVGGSNYPLTYDASSGAWVSQATVPVKPGAGPIPIELKWEETKGSQGGNTCKATGGNKCKGSFGVVQRSFGATADR